MWKLIPDGQSDGRRRAATLWHLSLRDRKVTAWQGVPADVPLYTVQPWRDRWLWHDEWPGTAPTSVVPDRPMWSSCLDGSDRQAVLGEEGRAQAPVYGFDLSARDGRAWVTSGGRDGRTWTLCRLVRTGGRDRLRRALELPHGWRWVVSGFDGGDCYLTAIPEAEGRLATWLRRVLRRPRVPVLCRVRLDRWH